MDNFTPLASLLGGMLIGVSASLLLLATGKIAGISGIVGGLINSSNDDRKWRAWFLAGLLSGGVILARLFPHTLAVEVPRSTTALLAAGLLVGFGTRLGSGCTSGHGVCGISRMSPRSLVATVVFMATGAATVLVVERLLGGQL